MDRPILRHRRPVSAPALPCPLQRHLALLRPSQSFSVLVVGRPNLDRWRLVPALPLSLARQRRLKLLRPIPNLNRPVVNLRSLRCRGLVPLPPLSRSFQGRLALLRLLTQVSFNQNFSLSLYKRSRRLPLIYYMLRRLPLSPLMFATLLSMRPPLRLRRR